MITNERKYRKCDYEFCKQRARVFIRRVRSGYCRKHWSIVKPFYKKRGKMDEHS